MTSGRFGLSFRRAFFPLSIVAVGLAAYYNSFAGVFLFDDRSHILGDRRLNVLWPVWEALARRRAVVDYSLALNREIGGESAWGYHAVNLAVHILAALTLYGIVRRTLLFRRRFGEGIHAVSNVECRLSIGRSSIRHSTIDNRQFPAPWIAWVTALIWLVHPLQTQSVTYLIQRAESLMGLFYLATLYCVLRGAEAADNDFGLRISDCGLEHTPGQSAIPNPKSPIRNPQSVIRNPQRFVATWWYVAAVVSCVMGMGSKAVMVTAPLVVLLYDRVFIAKSFARALRRRFGLYIGLASTWGVLWACGVARGVLSTTTRAANVGFSFKGITPLEYALTQFGVLMQYLELSIWPVPLCLDYNWQVARTMETILLPLSAIAVLMAGAVWACFCKPWLGFAGAWFFLILAPTSSIVPIKDIHFEHRMYLSLAAVILLVVIAADGALRHLAIRLSLGDTLRRCVSGALVVLVVTSLGYATVRRNRDYHSEVGMWRDVLTKRPSSSRAAENLGIALLGAGRMGDAMNALRDAVRISPRSADVHNSLGFALVAIGRLEDSIASFREAVRLRPGFARAHLNLGNALSDTNRNDEAIEHFRAALRFHPNYSRARLNLGNSLLVQGKIDEAVNEYRKIIRLDPRHDSAWGNLGTALLSKGQMQSVPGNGGDANAVVGEAIEAFRKALEINPDAQNVHNSLGIALIYRGKKDEGIEAFRQALRCDPNFAGAHFNLANCLIEKGELMSAISHYRTALQIDPANTAAREALEDALADLGRSPTD